MKKFILTYLPQKLFYPSVMILSLGKYSIHVNHVTKGIEFSGVTCNISIL